MRAGHDHEHAGQRSQPDLTLDFHTGEPTQRRYSRVKVIDMIFFIEGGGSSRAI